MVREPALALYAFCRLADDAVDGVVADRSAALAGLRERLDRAYRRQPAALPADRAFADAVARFDIPRALPEALLEGFEWDAAGRQYHSLAELQGYAARVAGSVGAMMALLMGSRTADQVARACDLGVAMQLSNIARDVGEDARTGRLYLPLNWLVEVGIDPEAWLAQPRFSPQLGALTARLLQSAESLYQRADAGILTLPVSCRPGISAARHLYAEIGREVARAGYDSVSRRAVVPALRKTWLIGRIVGSAGYNSAKRYLPPLPETEFLVDAVRHRVCNDAGLAEVLTALPAARTLDDKVAWVLNLFERLERQQREQRPSASASEFRATV